MQILLAVTFCLSVFSLRPNLVNASECPEISITFNKFDMANIKYLTNCTSILGSLSLASLDFDLNTTEINITAIQFPKLREITGFLVLFNVRHLFSLGSLFPNLMVIRGQQLIQSYSLIIFANPHLVKLDLESLISIQRGYVLIERCPALCYLDTINWSKLTDEDGDDLNTGEASANFIRKSAVECPTNGTCRGCHNENCWSAKKCQLNKTSHIEKSAPGLKCHESCLGGCTNNTANDCHVCLKLRVDRTCVDECPKDMYVLRETMRCITKPRCKRVYKMIPFNGECRRQCPVSYSQFHPVTNLFHPHECFKCETKCHRKCYGMEITVPGQLEHFRECTIVDGSMSIKLGLNFTDINQKLEETLGNIEIINGALKVYRSFGLTSLSFFRSLVKIDARNTTSNETGAYASMRSRELPSPYALEIKENENLQTLFNWTEKQQFEIIGGGISFHFNAKLCMSEIHVLQKITKYDSSHDSIQYDDNGYDEACHATGIVASHRVDSHSVAWIYWNVVNFGIDRRLVGYFVYYIEAPEKNITHFSGLDACSNKRFRRSTNKTDLPMISKKSHGDFWQSVFIPLEDVELQADNFETNITGLKQNTQYAYYVRTQLSLKHKDQVINVTQGQSPLNYFKTLPDRPRPPIVRTRAKTNVSLTLEWHPSTPEVELVQRYYIDVYGLVENVNEAKQRNYCRYPKVKEPEKTVTPEPICCRDQRAYLEFFQRGINQSCGPSDPSCKKTWEFVLFHHYVEHVLLTADSDIDPSERYRYNQGSHQVPMHHREDDDPIKQNNGSDAGKFYLHSHIVDDTSMDSILVPNLKPFGLYAFYVYACNNITNCSDYYFHSDRTAPHRANDDIGVTTKPDKWLTNIITFIVEPPVKPNAITVAYEIESIDYSRNVSEIRCIPRKIMEANNNTIRLDKLSVGQHSFRIRSVSLGDDGHFSNWIIVIVDKPDVTYTYGALISFVCIAIIIIGKLVHIKYRKWEYGRRHRADESLLNESDILMDNLNPPQQPLQPSYPEVRSSPSEVRVYIPPLSPPRQASPPQSPSSSIFLSNLGLGGTFQRSRAGQEGRSLLAESPEPERRSLHASQSSINVPEID